MPDWMDRTEAATREAFIRWVAAMHRDDRKLAFRLGALAVGATALGAVSVGAAAIARLAIGKAAIGRLVIGRLDVGDLRVRNSQGPREK